MRTKSSEERENQLREGRPGALIEHSIPGESLEASGTCRKTKFQLPMRVVLDEFNICVATVC